MVDGQGTAREAKLFAEAASRAVAEVATKSPDVKFMGQFGIGIGVRGDSAQIHEHLKRFRRWADEFADDQVINIVVNVQQSEEINVELFRKVSEHYKTLNPPPQPGDDSALEGDDAEQG